MAQHELEAALRREGEVEALKIWQRAEAEADQLRVEATQALDQRHQAAETRRRAETGARHETALAVARKQAQNYRLTAEDRLTQRLKTMAEAVLEELALTGGVRLFQLLAAEIPDYPWQRVTVNPRDKTAAGKAFPTAEIFSDQGISGGLEVQSQDDRIRIINSLEKRLEHLWPELLPDLFKKIRPMAGDDETFA